MYKFWFIFIQTASSLSYHEYIPRHSGHFVCFGEQIQTYMSGVFYDKLYRCHSSCRPSKNDLSSLSEYKCMHAKNPQNLNQPQQNQNTNPKEQMWFSKVKAGHEHLSLRGWCYIRERSVALQHVNYCSGDGMISSVGGHKYGEWHYWINKIFLYLPRSASPAVLHKPPRSISWVLHQLLRSGRHAEFLLTKSSNVIDTVMEKIRINPGKSNCIPSI